MDQGVKNIQSTVKSVVAGPGYSNDRYQKCRIYMEIKLFKYRSCICLHLQFNKPHLQIQNLQQIPEERSNNFLPLMLPRPLHTYSPRFEELIQQKGRSKRALVFLGTVRLKFQLGSGALIDTATVGNLYYTLNCLRPLLNLPTHLAFFSRYFTSSDNTSVILYKR